MTSKYYREMRGRVLKITKRYRPEHPFTEWIIRSDDLPPPLFEKPILHSLANFISSKVFKNEHTIEDVFSVQPPERDYKVLEWADDKKDKPVLPKWTSNGQSDKARKPNS